MLAILSREFDVPEPKFRFNKTYRGLHYWKVLGGKLVSSTVTIPRPELIPVRTKRTVEVKLLHEFTHHLVTMRWQQGRGPNDTHGQIFQQHLWNVVHAWLGDASKYPWETEYDKVRVYGERRIARAYLEGIEVRL